MAVDGAAAAAAPVPARVNRPIVIHRRKKPKSSPHASEHVRNADGVGPPRAQPPALAPRAKPAYERAEDVFKALGPYHARWAADSAAFEAVRNFQSPPAEGGEPAVLIGPLPGADQNLSAQWWLISTL